MTVPETILKFVEGLFSESQKPQYCQQGLVNQAYYFFSNRETRSILVLSSASQQNPLPEWQQKTRNWMLKYIEMDYVNGTNYNPDGDRKVNGTVYPTSDPKLFVHNQIGNGVEIYFLEFAAGE